MELPEISKRIQKLIKMYADNNVAKFVRLTDIASVQKINRIFHKDPRNDKYPLPSIDVVLAISNKLENVDLNWLLKGEGELTTSTNEVNEPVAHYNVQNEDTLKRIEQLEALTAEQNEKIDNLAHAILEFKYKTEDEKEQAKNG